MQRRSGAGEDPSEEEESGRDGSVEIPIDGVLDLHTFRASEVKDLIPDYIAACRQRGIFDLRIIHGKGTGTMRETVRSILQKLPGIASFRTAGEDAGGWGATLVELKRD